MKKFLKPDEKITFCRADKKDSGKHSPFTALRLQWGKKKVRERERTRSDVGARKPRSY